MGLGQGSRGPSKATLSSQNGPDPHSKQSLVEAGISRRSPHRLAIPIQRKGQRPADSPTQAGERIFCSSVLVAFPYNFHRSQQATTQVFVLEEILGAAWTGGRSLRFKITLCLSPRGPWACQGLSKPPSLPLKDGATWPSGEDRSDEGMSGDLGKQSFSYS